jgi:hypothetical protein
MQLIAKQFLFFRRDLLKLIGVGEFSLEASFLDPCLSFVLPEVLIGIFLVEVILLQPISSFGYKTTRKILQHSVQQIFISCMPLSVQNV